MMRQPILHPTSKTLLEAYMKALPQALIITGKAGTGTLEVAKYISESLGSPLDIIVPKKKSKDGNRFEADTKNGRVITEDVRALYDSVRGKQTSPRVFIIQSADRMMANAQHALLKLLEEPADNVYFLLETYNAESLFPTIRSRSQTLTILPLSSEQSEVYVEELGVTDPKKRVQLKYIAEGLPVELEHLVSDEEYFKERAERISDARQLLQADSYQKLMIVQKYQTNREQALQLIESAMQMTRHSVSVQPHPALITQLEELLAVKERIASNYNIRLQLTKFVL
jgi:DNA polymerase III delta prime subunit